MPAPAIDVTRRARFSFPSVPARVVDVDIEAVLVRGVTEPAEARAEVAAFRPAEITDTNPGRVGMSRCVLVEYLQEPP